MSDSTAPETPKQNAFSMDWSDRYAVGVDIIDRQHQKLFRLIDQLARGIQAGNSDATLMTVFDELADYTKTHFETEARLMAGAEYPDSQDHLVRHRELEASLGELVDKAKRGEPWVSLETMNFLRHWLYHHIDDTDRQLAKFLKNREI
jgi:hemerythrin-like metal-binding protein